MNEPLLQTPQRERSGRLRCMISLHASLRSGTIIKISGHMFSALISLLYASGLRFTWIEAKTGPKRQGGLIILDKPGSVMLGVAET